MTHSPPAIIYDLVTSGSGVLIKDRSDDSVVYALKFDREGKKGILGRRNKVTTLHRAPDDTGALPHHFAKWEGTEVEIGHNEESKVEMFQAGQYLQRPPHAALFARANIFHIDGQPYQLRKLSGSNSLELFDLRDEKSSTPLALFRRNSPYSSSLASIRVYAHGVWNTKTALTPEGAVNSSELRDTPHNAVVAGGKPTKVLERLIIAENIYDASQKWWCRLL